MELKCGEEWPQSDNGGVADEHGIDARLTGEVKHADGLAEFALSDVDVEGEVNADTAGVGVGDDVREVFGGEVPGAAAGVEGLQAEVDSVGAGFDGGAEGVGVHSLDLPAEGRGADA